MKNSGKIKLRIDQKITLLMSGSILIIFIVLGYLITPTADDFCNVNQIYKLNSSIYQYVIYNYENWTGRVYTTFALGILLKNISLNYVSALGIIMSMLFIATNSLILKYSFGEMKYLKCFILSLLVSMLNLVLMRNIPIGEIVFWPTGGVVYLFSIFVGYYFLNIVQDEKKKNSFIFIIGIISGGMLEMLSIALIIYLILNLILKKHEKIDVKKNIYGLVGLIVGSIILFFAPGNFKRASFGQVGVLKDPLEVLKVAEFKILEFLKIASYREFTILSIILVLTWLIQKEKKLIDNNNKKEILKIFKFLVAGMGSILPMLVVPDFIVARTSAVLYFFTFSAFLTFLIVIIKTTKGSLVRIEKILVILLFLYFSQKSIRWIGDAIIFRNEVRERHERIVQSKEDSLEINKIQEKIPAYIHFNDITENSENWINICVSEYYKKKLTLKNKNEN